ncbi:MAG: proline dehydrogenase family protein [Sphaerobacter sp.]|nr:proline dehydrogenase family protein [Sphaerobacter sp.]
MPSLRRGMLALAETKRIERFITQNGVSKGFALRFVAGETLDEAIAVTSELNAAGLSATLDLLGENVTSEEDARAATEAYCEILDRIAASGVNSNISIKLTMLGLDISDELARCNTATVVERARAHGNFVRIDMESSAYTQRTLDIAYDLHAAYPGTVGIVLQSYLYRTDRDVRDAIERGIRVRLVKGAYAESDMVAYPSKKEVDAAYRRQMEALLEGGNYPAFATHDEKMIAAAKEYARRHGIGPERFEFQMLYGIRRDLQLRLVREGYNVRVYVPYGTQWYPYLTRRLAERPANLLFVIRNLLKG